MPIRRNSLLQAFIVIPFLSPKPKLYLKYFEARRRNWRQQGIFKLQKSLFSLNQLKSGAGGRKSLTVPKKVSGCSIQGWKSLGTCEILEPCWDYAPFMENCTHMINVYLPFLGKTWYPGRVRSYAGQIQCPGRAIPTWHGTFCSKLLPLFSCLIFLQPHTSQPHPLGNQCTEASVATGVGVHGWQKIRHAKQKLQCRKCHVWMAY